MRGEGAIATAGRRARFIAFFATVGFSVATCLAWACNPPPGPLPLLVPEDTVLASEPVGTLPGEVSVSSDGAGQYRIPLWLPPGRGAAQPELSLSYDSSRGNGPLGVGWALEGLSSISRCRATIALDGTPRAVRFDAGDAFCLDGARLMPIGLYAGSSRVEYRTERDSFRRVVAWATDALGPTEFRVWDRDGRILRYGRTPEARTEGRPFVFDPSGPRVDSGLVRYRWMLDRISDRAGNFTDVEYDRRIESDGTVEHQAVRIT